MEIVASLSESVRATRPAWQEAMRTAIREVDELCRIVGLPEDFLASRIDDDPAFTVFVPRNFAAKMRLGDPDDPLLLQVLPRAEERLPAVGFSGDPVGDLAAQVTSGLLQKYHGRVLLVATGACAIHCRYCFRQFFPYQEGSAVTRRREALAAIESDPSIEEVILSGGDPLTLPDAQLLDLALELAAIPHIRRLRVHTRLPIVIPERVTDELIQWLRGTRLAPIMVVHANHPREVDEPVSDALLRLVDSGIPVLNQSVLLRGVNDDADTLAELSRRLVNIRVLPYYLHQLDRVRGTAHFEVNVDRGLQLMEELRGRLPGYAIPRYVQESAGDMGKGWLL